MHGPLFIQRWITYFEAAGVVSVLLTAVLVGLLVKFISGVTWKQLAAAGGWLVVMLGLLVAASALPGWVKWLAVTPVLIAIVAVGAAATLPVTRSKLPSRGLAGIALDPAAVRLASGTVAVLVLAVLTPAVFRLEGHSIQFYAAVVPLAAAWVALLWFATHGRPRVAVLLAASATVALAWLIAMQFDWGGAVFGLVWLAALAALVLFAMSNRPLPFTGVAVFAIAAVAVLLWLVAFVFHDDTGLLSWAETLSTGGWRDLREWRWEWVYTFGWWAVAVALAVFAFRGRPVRTMLIVVAVLAVSTAAWMSTATGRIEIDTSERDRLERERIAAAQAAFAGSVADDVNLAATQPAGEAAAGDAGTEAEAGAVPAYRQGGKVEREGGRSVGDTTIQRLATDVEAEAAARRGKRLKPADLRRALAISDFNRGLARVLFLVTVTVVVVDYLRRFNRTFDRLFPLPLAGRTIDAIAPKSYSVYLRTEAQDDAVLPGYLARAVAKGETFLLFGGRDPWPGAGSLPRVSVLGATLAGLDKRVVGPDADRPESEYLLESLWFDRACFVVEGQPQAKRVLAALVNHLQHRAVPRARVRRAVSVVWASDPAPPPEVLDDLSYLCRVTNFRLMVVAPHPLPGELRRYFEEVADPAEDDELPLRGEVPFGFGVARLG